MVGLKALFSLNVWHFSGCLLNPWMVRKKQSRHKLFLLVYADVCLVACAKGEPSISCEWKFDFWDLCFGMLFCFWTYLKRQCLVLLFIYLYFPFILKWIFYSYTLLMTVCSFCWMLCRRFLFSIKRLCWFLYIFFT